jgi:hypothetical protein
MVCRPGADRGEPEPDLESVAPRRRRGRSQSVSGMPPPQSRVAAGADHPSHGPPGPPARPRRPRRPRRTSQIMSRSRSRPGPAGRAASAVRFRRSRRRRQRVTVRDESRAYYDHHDRVLCSRLTSYRYTCQPDFRVCCQRTQCAGPGRLTRSLPQSNRDAGFTRLSRKSRCKLLLRLRVRGKSNGRSPGRAAAAHRPPRPGRQRRRE